MLLNLLRTSVAILLLPVLRLGGDSEALRLGGRANYLVEVQLVQHPLVPLRRGVVRLPQGLLRLRPGEDG